MCAPPNHPRSAGKNISLDVEHHEVQVTYGVPLQVYVKMTRMPGRC
jgi:hypothetical protein